MPKLNVGERTRAEKLVDVIHELQDSAPMTSTVGLLPLTYCYAFVNQWLWALVKERDFVLTQGFRDAGDLREKLLSVDAAFICLVGAQLPLMEQAFPHDSFPGIGRVHFAGGLFPQHRLDRIAKWFPRAQVYNNYGCAEAMPRLTMRKAEASALAYDVGWALPGIEMKTGERNEVLFRSPYSAVAYVDDEGLHCINDQTWVPTGDLGRPGQNGKWELLGRANDVFKRYGEKIALPHLIATVLRHWDGTAYFYHEDDPNDEPGHVLMLTPSATAEQVREILLAFRKNHPRPHWPLRIESAEDLPMLANGKVNVTKLSTVTEKTEHWRQRL
jgi:acyl-CoA synthetase (AMP-forming)/AMP-acid ligase II